MPDDHYTCKICGQYNCVCSNTTQRRVTPRPKTLGEILAGTNIIGYKPRSFIRDFKENSVTWKFDTNDEADAFAKVITDLINGVT